MSTRYFQGPRQGVACKPVGARPLGRLASLTIAMTVVGALCIAAPAQATGPFPDSLERADRQRLDAFDATRKQAIQTAQTQGAPRDVAELKKVLAGKPMAVAPAEMAGEWRCRTLKLGGLLPLTIYSWFRCRITDDSAGLRLEKLTGSQRTAGTFYDVGGTRLGYAGASSVSGEPVRRYGPDTQHNDVGYLVPVARDRLRLELPLPPQESQFDILELRR